MACLPSRAFGGGKPTTWALTCSYYGGEGEGGGWVGGSCRVWGLLLRQRALIEQRRGARFFEWTVMLVREGAL